MDQSAFSRHEPCPQCGSKDNVSVYASGRKRCETPGCDYFVPMSGEAELDQFQPIKHESNGIPLLTGLEIDDLPHRLITRDTCSKYGYKQGEHGGQLVEVAEYKDTSGRVVGQKVRTGKKEFSVRGTISGMLFGANLFPPGGKRLTITEGELDCLSIAEIWSCKFPCVSIPNGAASAAKAITANLQYIESFDTVVLCFDSDEAGRDAAEACAELISPGRVRIAQVPEDYNDPSGMLICGKREELSNLLWEAQPYKPEYVIAGKDTWELVNSPEERAKYRYGFRELDDMLLGIFPSELTLLTAGSGLGKSLLSKEIALNVVEQGGTVGIISLEETVRRAAIAFAGMGINKPLHLPDVFDQTSESERREGWTKTLGTDRIHFIGAFGDLSPDKLMPLIRYLAVAKGCDLVVLDHVSMLASGSEEQNERKFLDGLVHRLRVEVQNSGIHMIMISHLSRPSGGDRSHEEGRAVSSTHLRGSHSLFQLSNACVAMVRNPSSEDEDDRNRTKLVVLKNRKTGEQGEAGALTYDPETGRLTEEGNFI